MLHSLRNAGGSSPLARGALFKGLSSANSQRIIPARAGSTRRTACGPGCPTDHPRSRGEHEVAKKWAQRGRGSSPLARGAPSLEVALPLFVRIIPARAGSTAQDAGVEDPMLDHPRSRGEHAKRSGHHDLQKGSSPLARGAQHARTWIALAARIIPARAGSTLPD